MSCIYRNKTISVINYHYIRLRKESTEEKRKALNPYRIQGIKRAANQIRTGDLILTKDALYLLSYSSLLRFFSRRK